MMADEEKAILFEALHSTNQDPWETADAIFSRLEATGRSFSDSAITLRQDRDR